MTDFNKIAGDLVGDLSAPNDTPPPAPSFQEVWSARQIDFPVLKAGVEAISAALMSKFGPEFRLFISQRPTTDELRRQGIAPAEFRLERRGKPDISLPFEVSPSEIAFGEQSFSNGQDEAVAAALKAWMQPHFD